MRRKIPMMPIKTTRLRTPMIQRNTPHRQRPTVADGPIGQQLAGGVVHRGDVVGVEGVPQAERVSQ